MLLLLLKENEFKVWDDLFTKAASSMQARIGDIFTEAKNFTLEDLFSANLGILETRHNNQTKLANGQTKEVIVLRPGLIREVDNTIKPLAQIRDYYAEQKLRLRPKGKGNLDIPEKYLLRENDLLITTKGKPRLIKFSNKISTADELANADIEYVASHHFITLRPRLEVLSSLGIDLNFLTKMLELIVDVELPEKYEQKFIEREKEIEEVVAEKGKRSVSAIMPSLSLKDDILPLRLSVPMQKEKQNLFIEKVNELNALKQSVMGFIELYQIELLHHLKQNK